MEIGTIFTLDQYAEAYAYVVANNCKIEEIEPVMRVVSEEYEEVVQTPIKYSAVTHIEIDEDGNEHEIIDQPEHEEIIEEVIVKTREVEKEVRQYQIVAIPEPTEYEKAQARIAVLKALLDSKDYWTSKRADGEYTEEEWAEKVAIRKAWRAEINELEKIKE